MDILATSPFRVLDSGIDLVISSSRLARACCMLVWAPWLAAPNRLRRALQLPLWSITPLTTHHTPPKAHVV